MEYMNTPGRESIVLIIDDADKMDNSTMRSTVSLSRLGIVGSIVMSGASSLKRQLSQLHGDAQDSDAKQEHRLLTNATYIELKPLSVPQAAAFIHQQLQVAGGRGDTLFPPAAIDRIAVLSNGIPRAINALCDRALLLTEQAGQNSVSVGTVNNAAGQLHLIDAGTSVDGQVSAPTFTLFEGGAAPAVQEPAAPIVIRPATPPAAPPASKGRLIVFIVFLLLVLLGGIGSFLFLRQAGPGGATPASTTPRGESTAPGAADPTAPAGAPARTQ
jgi:hypothetical protein